MKYIEWIFSGIGVVILTWLIHMISKLIHKYNNKDHEKNKEYFDDSKFISEYPPDGINILVGNTIIKRWTIQNNGDIIWKNRYLKCINDVPNFFYPEKRIVKIPELKPGEQFTLKVKYFAKEEGEYFSQWKMFNEFDEMIFPKKRGLGVFVRVVTEEKYAKR